MDELNKAVLTAFASTFSFYLKAHGFHWNGVGEDFYENHLLFERIYDEVYGSVDDFAEKIRTLQITLPASLSGILGYTKVADCVENPPPAPIDMVKELLADNDTLLGVLKDAYNLCDIYSKFGFENFLAERIDAHEKHGWMLRSSLA